MKGEEYWDNMNLNLCISILEFKWLSIFFKISFHSYLCISILEFKFDIIK